MSTVVIPNVGSTVTRLQDVPGYTYATGYAIARVAQPASNGTITAAMITDLRQVANPRRDRQLNAHSQVQAEAETLTSTTQAGEVFPNTTNDFTVRIPEWATRMLIVGTWSQAAGAGRDRVRASLGASGGLHLPGLPGNAGSVLGPRRRRRWHVRPVHVHGRG
ncbi:hypothetical protein P9139_18145 [Curtobacterium flaccumfaciens]|nr:hypothetical protein P9139_18145 [Curtobacterium flaccumfaciens]